MNVEITAGGFEILSSGWLQALKSEAMNIKVGAITARYVYREDADKTKAASIRSESDHKNLILTIIIEGVLPTSPLSYGSTRPVKIGTTDGYTIFISWQASIISTTIDQYDLRYTIYKTKVEQSVSATTPAPDNKEGEKS